MVTERKTKYKTGKEIVAEIKEGFKECGRSPKLPYTFEFHLYFKTAKAAKQAVPDVKKLGLKTDVVSEGKLHALIGFQSMVVDYKKFGDWGQKFMAIARKHDGEFDGWQMGPPEGEELNPFTEDGEIDFEQLMKQAGLVIGSQAMKNPHKHEVVITIPGAIEPIERGELYEDPLIAVMKKKRSLGVVLGGHSELAPHKKGGMKVVAASIRLGTRKPAELQEFLKTWMKENKFPKKTTVTIQ